MDFLGVGPLELLFVVLIAIIVLGPKDIGRAARSAGRFLNRFYRSETWKNLAQASRTLRALPNRLAREAELEELDKIRKDLDATKQDAAHELRSIQDGMNSSGPIHPPASPPAASPESQADVKPDPTSS